MRQNAPSSRRNTKHNARPFTPQTQSRSQGVGDAARLRVLRLKRREHVARALALGRDERQHEAQQHDAGDVERRADLRDRREPPDAQ